MKTYFDTSLLLKVYVPEDGTPQALAIVRECAGPFPLSHLLEIELRTAIRMKHGRGEITAAEMSGSLQALESDLAKGILARPDYDLETVYLWAETISAKHAAATLARTPRQHPLDHGLAHRRRCRYLSQRRTRTIR